MPASREGFLFVIFVIVAYELPESVQCAFHFASTHRTDYVCRCCSDEVRGFSIDFVVSLAYELQFVPVLLRSVHISAVR